MQRQNLCLAYGGEELVPPAYGKVFISIKPFNGVFLSRAVKENINRELRKVYLCRNCHRNTRFEVFVCRNWINCVL